MNGIRKFRLQKQINLAELARAVGTTRQQMGRLETGARKLTTEWAERIAAVLGVSAQELMFPENTRVDIDRFRNVFAIAQGEDGEEPSIWFQQNLLQKLIPDAMKHRLQLAVIDTDDMDRHIAKGDTVILDMDDVTRIKPGVYALEIGGVCQWRYLAPTTTGEIIVRSGNPDIDDETVRPDNLTILGRARLRISTI